jgi:hypothetical protein
VSINSGCSVSFNIAVLTNKTEKRAFLVSVGIDLEAKFCKKKKKKTE